MQEEIYSKKESLLDEDEDEEDVDILKSSTKMGDSKSKDTHVINSKY